jgi:hypothetical protein
MSREKVELDMNGSLQKIQGWIFRELLYAFAAWVKSIKNVTDSKHPIL